jgi:hypothetical protein
MKRFFARILIFSSALLAICLVPCLASDPNVSPKDDEVQDMARSFGMDPAVCEGLQSQIDKVVNIAQSALSDEEKISRLTETLTESLENMQQASLKDPEMDRIVKQYLTLIQGLLGMVKDSFRTDGKQISPEAKNELQKLKIMTSTYVSMMKMLCPKLTLPEVVDK